MSNLFSVSSPIVLGTLVLLILLSIATWSIAIFKLWKQWQAKQHDREFIEQHHWSATSIRHATHSIGHATLFL